MRRPARAASVAGMLEPPATLEHVEVRPLAPELLREVLDRPGWDRFLAMIRTARERLAGRVLWTVSSTAQGGGVAEMLHTKLAYVRGAGLDMHWVVIRAGGEFFRVTKRLHNRLHEDPGDGGPLGGHERDVLEATLAPCIEELLVLARPGDVVLLHDPQPAAMAPALRAAGLHVVWRCHIGADRTGPLAREAQRLLLPFVRSAEAVVVSRRAHVWDGLDPERVHVIPPSIDTLSAKNQELDDDTVARILAAAGLLAADGGDRDRAMFRRRDGTPGVVRRRAGLDGLRALDAWRPLVCQVSRWDRLKDPAGVVRGFVDHVLPGQDAQLLLAGPAPLAVSDDPEGPAILAELHELVGGLDAHARARVGIAELPLDDAEENAAIVNALQRRSAVVVQKSLQEGFGLTVAEAMWKGRPVVAGRVGGIQDQVEDGRTGLLVDPADLAAFGAAVARVLADPELAHRLGAAARQRVRAEFLGPRHLTQWADVVLGVLRAPGAVTVGTAPVHER
jgi:trehalose synthase